MPRHVPKHPTPDASQGGNGRSAKPLSSRQMVAIVLAGIWVTVSVTVGYYIGEPYLKKGDETPQRVASVQTTAVPRLASPSAAAGEHPDSSDTTPSNLIEMRLLREEVARLRFWLLLAWVIQTVVGSIALWWLVLRGRRFGRRLMRQLTKLNAHPLQPQAPQNPAATDAPTPNENPPSRWPHSTTESAPLTALTASLRRNREAIARSRIELENRSASDLTLRTR